MAAEGWGAKVVHRLAHDYARRASEHGWRRAVLMHQIESGLIRRQGQAITNFSQTLPAPQSGLAHEIMKDPYDFEFLDPADAVSERELQRSLLDHLRALILELGKGFAFVGSLPARLQSDLPTPDDLQSAFSHTKPRCA